MLNLGKGYFVIFAHTNPREASRPQPCRGKYAMSCRAQIFPSRDLQRCGNSYSFWRFQRRIQPFNSVIAPSGLFRPLHWPKMVDRHRERVCEKRGGGSKQNGQKKSHLEVRRTGGRPFAHTSGATNGLSLGSPLHKRNAFFCPLTPWLVCGRCLFFCSTPQPFCSRSALTPVCNCSSLSPRSSDLGPSPPTRTSRDGTRKSTPPRW